MILKIASNYLLTLIRGLSTKVSLLLLMFWVVKTIVYMCSFPTSLMLLMLLVDVAISRCYIYIIFLSLIEQICLKLFCRRLCLSSYWTWAWCNLKALFLWPALNVTRNQDTLDFFELCNLLSEMKHNDTIPLVFNRNSTTRVLSLSKNCLSFPETVKANGYEKQSFCIVIAISFKRRFLYWTCLMEHALCCTSLSWSCFHANIT